MNRMLLLLIKELKQDSRKSIKLIAEENSIPFSTLYDCYNRYFKKRYFKNTILLNHEKFGKNIMVHFSIVSDNELMEIFLKIYNEIINLYLINSSKYIGTAVFKNIEESEIFFDKIRKYSNIQNIEIYHITKRIKVEGVEANFN